jgi:hypothetical protein
VAIALTPDPGDVVTETQVVTETVTEATTTEPPPPDFPPAGAVWSAGFEAGDFVEFGAGGGVDNHGQQNTGGCTSSVVTSHARTGSHSMEQRYAGRGNPACRATRYTETNEYEVVKTYTMWRWFPAPLPSPTNDHWNLFQLKSKVVDGPSHPTWVLEAETLPGHEGLFWNVKAKCGQSPQQAPFRCPYSTSSASSKQYFQAARTPEWSGTLIPVRTDRWTKHEFQIVTSQGYTGRFVVLIDRVELFRFDNIKTSFSAPRSTTSWGITNYSNGLGVPSYSIFTDDVSVVE